MKIIRKSKDIYDWVSGSLMVDDNVVYDRRDEHLFRQDNEWLCVGSRFVVERHHYHGPNKKLVVLECGRTRYVFCIEREVSEIENNSKGAIYEVCKLSPTFIGEVDYIVKNDGIPLKIYTNIQGFYSYSFDERFLKSVLETFRTCDIRGEVTTNPILASTCLVSLIDPYKVWQNIYDYLSSLKDIEIIDNRTDVEKAESHGFDKKTSFRNIK